MENNYINYETLLRKKFPAYDWTMSNPEDYDTLVWNETACEKPTKEFLDMKLAGARANYAQHRNREYPSIQDQLDILYHGGYDAWKAVIQSVKDKYPKPV